MGLIRYPCSHILGHHEPIHVKYGVRVFHHVLRKYGHENAEMQKRKFDDVTLQYSMHECFIGFVCDRFDRGSRQVKH